jgi:hypothetical protein
MGQGSRTGRALGFCTGYDTPGYVKGFGGDMGRGFGFGRGMGRGFGRGMGRGMGYGRGFNFGRPAAGYFHDLSWMPALGKEDEIRLLKSQAESLKRSQKDIEKRLGELEKETE